MCNTHYLNRLEDRLEKASNFSSWKICVMIVLREMEIEEYVKSNKSNLENDLDKTTWKDSYVIYLITFGSGFCAWHFSWYKIL